MSAPTYPMAAAAEQAAAALAAAEQRGAKAAVAHLRSVIARAEAAEQRAEAYRAFAAAVVRGVYPGDTGAVIANHLDTDLLPDALTRLHERLAEQRAEALAAEVARLRAVIAEEVTELPVWPDGAYQTPAERDVSAVRAALVAALAEAQPTEVADV